MGPSSPASDVPRSASPSIAYGKRTRNTCWNKRLIALLAAGIPALLTARISPIEAMQPVVATDGRRAPLHLARVRHECLLALLERGEKAGGLGGAAVAVGVVGLAHGVVQRPVFQKLRDAVDELVYAHPDDPSLTGHMMIALNLANVITPDEMKARMDSFYARVKASPMWDPAAEMFLPGEIFQPLRAHAVRQRLRLRH